MPDPTKQTVSASQVPAVHNLSPYATRWMLWQDFAHGIKVDVKENDRMDWGTRLEPTILKAAADELRADILPHDQTKYLRHPGIPVGCTPDGYMLDPQRGLGFVEAKNIDWLRWKQTWDEQAAADHVELQLQTQLMVPHPDHGFPRWGCIAALVGGNELRLYNREPLRDVHAAIEREARQFLADVAAQAEPEVLGVPIEIPALTLAYPKADPLLTLDEEDFDAPTAIKIARMIDEYMLVTDREKTSKKEREILQAKLLGWAGMASGIIVHGRMFDISKSEIPGGTRQVKSYTRTVCKGKLLNLAMDLDALDPPPEPPEMNFDIFN